MRLLPKLTEGLRTKKHRTRFPHCNRVRALYNRNTAIETVSMPPLTDFVQDNDAPKKDEGALAFLEENVWRPGANALAIQPYNAFANTVNAFSNKLGNGDVLEKATPFEYTEKAVTTFAGFTQNVSSTLGSIAPYIVASELAGAGMRTGGRVLQLEGNAARFAASKLGSCAVGAGAYDFARDVHQGETRLTNALGGAFAFGAFSYGNHLAGRATSLAERVGIRTITGVAGAELNSLISHGTISGEAALSGAIMGNVFPLAHEQFARVSDTAWTAAGRSLNRQRFNDLHNLNGRPEIPQWQNDLNPLAKVKFSETNTPGPRKNTIHINEELLKVRAEEIMANANKQGLKVDDKMAHKQALAEEVAGELNDLNVARNGRAGSVLTNRDIIKAVLDGRIQVLVDKPNAAGTMEKQPMTIPELRDRLGNNSLDVRLGNQFLHPVAEPTDFRTISPKESLKRLETFEVPDGGAVTLQPQQAILAFTKETIVLTESPLATAQGLPAVVAHINQNSSLARHFVEIHITAPTLNNGTRNPITLEIVNNGPAPITLTPGMTFGAIMFESMNGHHGPTKNPSAMHGQTKPNGVK
jgi:deoxycytidine triphosphate deaminase